MPSNRVPPDGFVEGRDYVVERGAWVFTREYLLRRGHCCKSGCRNCPYGFRKPQWPPKPQTDVAQDPPDSDR